MRLTTILCLATASVLQTVVTVQAGSFAYGTTKIRGVNLGGWLVLEAFLTPSIFNATGDFGVIDEYTYGKKYGSAVASQRLQNHWDTFITEDSIKTIKSYGLNHVRIPIGYWALNKNSTEPFATGQLPYLVRAVGWAQKYGIKVIIDIHGAPGSQNGFDNSGKKGPIQWHLSNDNVQKTLQALKMLIDRFIVNPQFRDTVTSIQPLNEPGGFIGGSILDVTKQFYYDSYGAIRYPYGNSTTSDTLVSIHDAFQAGSYWKNFMNYPGWQNVALDTHFYSVFSAEQAKWSNDYRIQDICSFKNNLVASNNAHWTYVGEFFPGYTDCAGSTTVSPHSAGSFYDGTVAGSTRVGSCVGNTGSGSKFSAANRDFMRRYWEAQVTVFEAASGWVMWNWKSETADEWSYYQGVQYGWIPKDPTQRKYPDPCLPAKARLS